MDHPLDNLFEESDKTKFLDNDGNEIIRIDEFPNKYADNNSRFSVFLVEDEIIDKDLKKILPNFIQCERNASTKFDKDRKVHSSPAKYHLKLSQENLSTLRPEQFNAFKRRSSDNTRLLNTSKTEDNNNNTNNDEQATKTLSYYDNENINDNYDNQLTDNINCNYLKAEQSIYQHETSTTTNPIDIVRKTSMTSTATTAGTTPIASSSVGSISQLSKVTPSVTTVYPTIINSYNKPKLQHENSFDQNKFDLAAVPIIKWLDIPNNELYFDRSDAFGPKIKSTDDIPGTPMESTLGYNNSSYQSSQSNLLNDPQRKFSDDFDIEKPASPALSNNNSTSNNNKNTNHIESIINQTNHTHNHHVNSSHSLSKKHRLSWDKRSNSLKIENEDLDAESLMFRDGRRRIDMMLCYEEEDQGVMTENEAKKRDKRRLFQENLIKEGLELEIEDKANSFDEKTFFVKIHIPWRTESRYAEVMNMKLPIKRFITISVKAWANEKNVVKHTNLPTRCWKRLRKLKEYDEKLIEKEPSFYSATAGANPQEQFIVKDRCTSYNSAQRSLIVMQILLRVKYDDTEKAGIRRLLNDGTYLACFPLHEGRFDTPHSSGAIFDRRLLYLEWARPSKWYKKQPLCLVRKYFGDKIAFYFCWLGFYTQMLVYPAIVGTLCFIYGLASMDSKDNVPSKEICDAHGVGNKTLCPLCDKACSYQQLSDSCLFARITYLFDNPSTVFFAIFMSFWATTFLELWKRKQSVLVWEWDLQSNDSDEDPRPEFETNVKTFRINPVTREKEPYMPSWSRSLRFVASASAVLFMIAIVLGAVLGTIIYRIALVSVIYGGGIFFVKTHAKLVTTMTAALINLVIIMILTRIYHKIAIHLTNMENPRTQTEYEDSYTFKIFFFEFMNFYSSLIYIAFFKGRFFDYPGDDIQRRSDFFALKGDICDPAGCLSELCIQLAIIMVGKQVWNNFMEYLYPTIYNWWRRRKHTKQTKDESHLHMSWEQDYHLQDPGRLALFDEYLEMIIQYGFVTLFVAAFPLAPLFAFLNNIAEIRLDAYKMVTQSRRPLAERVEDIGAWYGILRIITYTAVVSNAFVIAYTSDFIPRMVYKYVYSKKHNLEGYIEDSLSVFNTADYRDEWGTKAQSDPDTCQYRGYRNGPDHESDAYGLSSQYWHVFAARLAFVVIFEHVVFILTSIMQFIIPDIPVEVKTQMQREQLLAKEAKYQHGLKKSRENDYEDLLHAIREQNNNSRQSQPNNRTSWARRLSRASDGLDAHVEISNRPRRSIESTVWEVS